MTDPNKTDGPSPWGPEAGQPGKGGSRKSRPWPFYAILAITILPIIAAYVAYYTGLGVPKETVNHGVLVEPAPNIEDLIGSARGEVPPVIEPGIWRLLVPVPTDCAERCQKNLYLTRQVHIRLGEKAERVYRYAVNLSGAQGEAYLESIAAEHPRLKTFSVAEETWQRWLSETGLPRVTDASPFYLLVDPQGFAVMVYTNAQDGNQLLDDIKRILRYSPEG